MRSRELVRKEIAELFASRSFWLLLVMAGLLTGQAFIDAVRAYAEASDPHALAQGLSPLEGILTPTLGAYDLAITLLFPFVAIRLVAAEKSSDALKLMLQWPVRLGTQIAAKVIALLVAWVASLIPFAIALVLWRGYGGHLYAPEVLNLMAGYTLRYLLTASLAMAAAALMPGAANAAIVVLGFTISTWALDFIATGRGGLLQTLASYTPAATLRGFERGLFRADVAIVLIVLFALFAVLTAIWLRLGQPKLLRTVLACVAAAAIVAGAAHIEASADLSENRRNSFSPADQRALAAIRGTLEVTVYLAAEDPRMNDFEREVLVKLRRAMPVAVRYPFAGRSGLFDSDPRYGEIHYRLGNRSAVSRSSTEEIVLETVYGLAGLPVPARQPSPYPGYPLRAQPRGAALAFYLLWPLAVLAFNRIVRRS